MRRKLVEAAIRAARAVHYLGVGTVEFLVDQADQFYFLEMNTRLQVEHPVTEAITGIDLVGWQLDLAEGKPLPKQEAIQPRGHAIEYRLYAEDPVRFLPSPGTLTVFQVPEGEGIRVDAGVEQGNAVSPFYDPMIAKCIVSGCNREEALKRSRIALEGFRVEGIKTNIPMLLRLLDEPLFRQGQYHTQILKNLT
jgi:acetyl-CoA carboxylase biotin carboxylase subunit